MDLFCPSACYFTVCLTAATLNLRAVFIRSQDSPTIDNGQKAFWINRKTIYSNFILGSSLTDSIDLGHRNHSLRPQSGRCSNLPSVSSSGNSGPSRDPTVGTKPHENSCLVLGNTGKERKELVGQRKGEREKKKKEDSPTKHW